jgi:hypothetical protein
MFIKGTPYRLPQGRILTDGKVHLSVTLNQYMQTILPSVDPMFGKNPLRASPESHD